MSGLWFGLAGLNGGKLAGRGGRLYRFTAEGLSSYQIAVLLDAILETPKRCSRVSDQAELVWTGPDVAGTTNRDTGAVVDDLFGRARSEVLLAGFGVYQGKEAFRRSAERAVEVPGLRVRLFLDARLQPGDATLASELVWKFFSRSGEGTAGRDVARAL